MSLQARSLPFSTSSGRKIFYQFQPGRGTPLVFLNGLDDSMELWLKTVGPLQTPAPRLFVDLIGQGESLQNELPREGPLSYEISVEEQGRALLELGAHLGFSKSTWIGNSYGGGVTLWLAAHSPESVEKLILINPFVLRLDLSFALARVYAFQFKLLRQLTPQAFQAPFQAMENSYEKFIHHYMHFRFKKRIENPELREVSVDLARGMMEFNSFQVLKHLPESSVYLIFSELDTLVPPSLYREFWMRLPPSKKRNAFQLAQGDHLILEQAPQFICETLEGILDERFPSEVAIKTCWSRQESAAR